jgi:hypothetical protein
MRSRLIVPTLLSIIVTILLLVLPVFSQTFMRQELMDEHVRREQAEAVAHDQASINAVIPPTCLPAPLPSSPRPPVFTMQAAWFGEQLRFDVWREPCKDNSGLIVPLLRATPLSGTPFVCSPLFTVIQAGIQYNNIRLSNSSTSSSSSFCADLFVPTTLLIAQYSFDPQFDDTQAFQLIYDSDNIYTLSIAAAPPSRQMTLSLNQTAFRTGDTLRVGLGVQNPGLAFIADFYFAVLLPDGVTILFVTRLSPLNGVVTRLDADPRTFRPLLANVQLSQGMDITLTDFFVYFFAGGESPGTYTVFAVLTPPGAFNDGYVDPGDLLVIDARPFGFSP